MAPPYLFASSVSQSHISYFKLRADALIDSNAKYKGPPITVLLPLILQHLSHFSSEISILGSIYGYSLWGWSLSWSPHNSTSKLKNASFYHLAMLHQNFSTIFTTISKRSSKLMKWTLEIRKTTKIFLTCIAFIAELHPVVFHQLLPKVMKLLNNK